MANDLDEQYSFDKYNLDYKLDKVREHMKRVGDIRSLPSRQDALTVLLELGLKVLKEAPEWEVDNPAYKLSFETIKETEGYSDTVNSIIRRIDRFGE